MRDQIKNDEIVKLVGTALRETEKAICAQVPICCVDGEPRTWDIWLPKSRVRGCADGWLLPFWLALRKGEEVASHCRSVQAGMALSVHNPNDEEQMTFV